jgi:hypothetical protein
MSAIPGQLINKEVPVNFEGLRMGDVAKKNSASLHLMKTYRTRSLLVRSISMDNTLKKFL